MLKHNWNKLLTIAMSIVIFAVAATLLPTVSSADVPEDLPTTGFEDRNGEEWTTLEEELEFIQEIAELSDRVWYEEIGQSVIGRSIYMVYVGSEERSIEEIQDGRTIFFMGTPHGNEPAGREGALKTLRDLAFTDDPDKLEILENSTVLIMPTSNPDGREANTRQNAWGLDNNRDNLNLTSPENQTIARVLRDFTPDITIDAHERPNGTDPDIEYLWPRNLNVDRDIYTLNRELIEDYMMPDAEADGWTTALYGSPTGAGREDERILRNLGALRHGMTVLTESAGQAPNVDRVDMQISSYESILRFYHERFDEIAATVDAAPANKQADGANKAPYYFAGADDTPDQEVIMDPPVCGYLLDSEQAATIERHIDLFDIETRQISDTSIFITMDQPMMTVIPLLVDDRAEYNEVAAEPLEECPSIEGPEDLPTTGFEDRNGDGWTTLDEELEFIQEIAAMSDRVWYEEVGISVLQRPIRLLFVGAEQRTDEEVKDGRTIFIMGAPHGNEPAGREGALMTLRDLAFTDDPDKLEILENSTVLIMPTSNPDGRVANTRQNAWGLDNNRDNLNLTSPENQTMARILRDYGPDITVDAHERPGDTDPDLEYLWPRNLNVDRGIHALNVELVQDYMIPDAQADGWTAELYGSPTGAGREDERILRNMGGLRHGMTVLTESAGQAPYIDRVHMQISSFESILRFYHERFDEVAAAVDAAPANKQADGANKAPYYFAGADDTPDQEVIMDPPVCGYLLDAEQAATIERHIDLFGIETEVINDGDVFITMDQPMMTVIPLLVDDRAEYNEVAAEPLVECPADKSALQDAVNAASELNESDYTADSWAPFASALEDAEGVLADEDASQEDIDNALDALISAQDGLVAIEDEPADKSALQEKVDEAKGLNASDYTEKSWAAVAAALDAAEGVLANDDATQEDVDNALAALTAAINALKEKSTDPGDGKDPCEPCEDPGDGKDPGKGDGKDPGKGDGKDKYPGPGKPGGDGSGGGSKLPSTATSYFNWMLIGITLIVLAGGVWQLNRRRRAQ